MPLEGLLSSCVTVDLTLDEGLCLWTQIADVLHSLTHPRLYLQNVPASTNLHPLQNSKTEKRTALYKTSPNRTLAAVRPELTVLQVGVSGSVEPESNGTVLPTVEAVQETVLPQDTNGSLAVVQVSTSETLTSENGVDYASWVDPCAAGQVEACAALRASDSEPVEPQLEDKWSRRKTYSSLQVSRFRLVQV